MVDFYRTELPACHPTVPRVVSRRQHRWDTSKTVHSDPIHSTPDAHKTAMDCPSKQIKREPDDSSHPAKRSKANPGTDPLCPTKTPLADEIFFDAWSKMGCSFPKDTKWQRKCSQNGYPMNKPERLSWRAWFVRNYDPFSAWWLDNLLCRSVSHKVLTYDLKYSKGHPFEELFQAFKSSGIADKVYKIARLAILLGANPHDEVLYWARRNGLIKVNDLLKSHGAKFTDCYPAWGYLDPVRGYKWSD